MLCKTRRKHCEEGSSRTIWFTSFKSYQTISGVFFFTNPKQSPRLKQQVRGHWDPSMGLTSIYPSIAVDKKQQRLSHNPQNPMLRKASRVPFSDDTFPNPDMPTQCLLEHGQERRSHMLRRQSFVPLFYTSSQIWLSIIPPDGIIWDSWS